MSYKIGSFNVCKLNYNSKKEQKKNFEKISEIIREEGFDIVALQEVISQDTINYLMSYLGDKDWDYKFASPKKSNSTQAAEGYAFIWRKGRICKSFTYIDGIKRTYEPRIIDQYQKHSYDQLVRNPYYGRFSPTGSCKGDFSELRLINVHLRFSKNKNDDSSNGYILSRKNEFNVLTKSIYSKIADRVYGAADGEIYSKNTNDENRRDISCNNKPSYTIILGDYNLNLRRDYNPYPYLPYTAGIAPKTLTKHERETDFIMAHDGKIIQTVQDQRTTLKQIDDNDVNSDMQNELCGYANNYDHFSYDRNRFKCNLKIKYYEINAVKKYYDKNYSKYRNEISDHIPIAMEISTNNKENK